MRTLLSGACMGRRLGMGRVHGRRTVLPACSTPCKLSTNCTLSCNTGRHKHMVRLPQLISLQRCCVKALQDRYRNVTDGGVNVLISQLLACGHVYVHDMTDLELVVVSLSL